MSVCHKQIDIDIPVNTPLFANIDSDILENIFRKSSIKSFSAAETLILQGETPKYIYLIIDGKARTFRSNINGDETTLRMITSGETCMDTFVFIGGITPVSFQTTTKSSIMMIPADTIKKMSLKNNTLANNLLKIATNNYTDAIHQIDTMTIKSPVQKVGYFFLKQHLKTKSKNMEFKLPFKKSIIANHLGITPETFSRSVAQLKKMGLEIEGNTIRMLDAFALCHFCDIETAQNCNRMNKNECSKCNAN